MEHTKGKWKIKEEDYDNFGIYPEESAECIAVVWCGEYSANTAEANARRIVHCCNHFDELVEALEGIMKRSDVGINSNGTKRGIILNEIGNMAEKALNSAKSEI